MFKQTYALAKPQIRLFAAPTKMNNSKFLTRELKENPEFYKAFPHLAPEDFNEESRRFVDNTRKEPFFQSLQNQYANYLKPNDNEEFNARENELNFV